MTDKAAFEDCVIATATGDIALKHNANTPSSSLSTVCERMRYVVGLFVRARSIHCYLDYCEYCYTDLLINCNLILKIIKKHSLMDFFVEF